MAPHPVAAWLHLADNVVRLVSGACGLAILAYLALARWLRRPLRIRRWRFALPTLPIAAAQVAVGALNFTLLTATLHFLIQSSAPLSFWTTAGIYLLASMAALISHVPGGLGVTEFVVLSFVPGAGTWAALIVFRLVYYIVPLALGGLVLGLGEWLERLGEGRAQPSRTTASRNALT